MYLSKFLHCCTTLLAVSALVACTQSDDEESTPGFTPPPVGTPISPSQTPAPEEPFTATVLPGDGTASVPTNLAAIIIYFNKTMDETSIDNSTLSIIPSVPFTVDKSHLSTGNAVVFNLQGTLAASTAYALSTTGIKQSSGTAVADYSWQFSTASADDTTAPSAPSNLRSTVALSGTALTINWDASTDDTAVAGYRILRDNTIIGYSTTTSFTDKTIHPNTAYIFNVEALDYAGNSALSSNMPINAGNIVDNEPPSAPENISILSVTNTSVTLQWQESTDNVGVKGYNVYRNNVPIGTTETTSFFDNGLQAGTNYAFTIEAFDYKNNTARTNLLVTTKPVIDPTLTWVTPTRTEDNSCLAAIGGVRIYYGNNSRDYTRDLDLQLTDPGVVCSVTQIDSGCALDKQTCSYTPDVPDDTWYFVITVYDNEGRESLFSTQIFYDLTP